MIPLDDLLPSQINDAIALSHFLRGGGVTTFIEGAPSTKVAFDLARAGIIELREFNCNGLRAWEVVR
jgi:hypothetical protein